MTNTHDDRSIPVRHARWLAGLPRGLICLGLTALFPMLLGATCGLETCDIFNCDTLPFIEELLAPDEHAENGHDEEDGQMDMEDGDEHVDDDAHDDEEDEQMVDDEEMHDDHDSATRALRKLRDLTHGYEPPVEACNTYRAWLDGLRELEADMHRHVHQENNILFPKAIHHQAAIANH